MNPPAPGPSTRLILDTSLVTFLVNPTSPQAERLTARLNTSGRPIAATIVSFQESMKGWLAYCDKAKTPEQYVAATRKLHVSLDFYADIEILDFDDRAAAVFKRLKAANLKVGTMDLRIAAIVLANNGTLLSANLSDFRKVPGLAVEDWSAE